MSVKGNGPNICFYSNRCNWSKAFLQELAQSPFKNQFKYVCVDASPTRPKLPSFLKEVPTIVVEGDNEPKVSSEAFNWLSQEKMKVGKSNKEGPSPGEEEPEGWNSMENMSFAKGFGYSFNDSDTNTNGSGGERIPGAFQFLNGGSSSGVRNANDFPGGSDKGKNRSKKEELFDKQMEQYQKERNQGLPQGPNRQ
jgi:hypothetical protein